MCKFCYPCLYTHHREEEGLALYRSAQSMATIAKGAIRRIQFETRGGKRRMETLGCVHQPEGMDLIGTIALPSPAKDFGWHDLGYIHSAVMTGLKPSSTFSYKYGRFMVLFT
ncbi:hypothetical protein RIF29_42490 [Crotalaria pallida]|uniref:Uncharacterized protein n=1 Tax=Crotalaria pallida TaxID=3830 RepID=A0AAN9HSF0_CROPI